MKKEKVILSHQTSADFDSNMSKVSVNKLYAEERSQNLKIVIE